MAGDIFAADKHSPGIQNEPILWNWMGEGC